MQSPSSSSFASLTVAELRKKLKEKNLSIKGVKKDLVQRLMEAEVIEQQVEPNTPIDLPDSACEVDTESKVVELETTPNDPASLLEKENKCEKSEELQKVETTAPQPVSAETETENVDMEQAEVAKEIEAEESGRKRKEIEVNGSEGTRKRTRMLDIEETAQVDEIKEEEIITVVVGGDVGAGASTDTLCVRNFVRPLRQPELMELLNRFGKIKMFWMDPVKSHCFLSYSQSEEARSAREFLDGLTYPEQIGKKLSAEFIDNEVARELMEKQQRGALQRRKYTVEYNAENGEWSLKEAGWIDSKRDRLQARYMALAGAGQEVLTELEIKRGEGWETGQVFQTAVKKDSAAMILNVHSSFAGDLHQKSHQALEDDDMLTIEEPTPATEVPVHVKNLDELFHKTMTSPALYYRPWTDEEILARKQLCDN